MVQLGVVLSNLDPFLPVLDQSVGPTFEDQRLVLYKNNTSQIKKKKKQLASIQNDC